LLIYLVHKALNLQMIVKLQSCKMNSNLQFVIVNNMNTMLMVLFMKYI